MQFANGSTAGNAVINNTGRVSFIDTATAANAIITNNGNGVTAFANTSSAGGAHIINSSTGSLTEFSDASTAGGAVIVNNGGRINFNDRSTAANLC